MWQCKGGDINGTGSDLMPINRFLILTIPVFLWIMNTNHLCGYINKLKRNSRISKIFGSRTHGDPATPVSRVYSGEQVIFRTVMPVDKPRNAVFCIHGHTWKKQPKKQTPWILVILIHGVPYCKCSLRLEIWFITEHIPKAFFQSFQYLPHP